MKSSVDQLNETRVKVTVEVPFSELKSEIDQAYKALAQQVNIPGFRRGKAPRQLIDARIGRGPVLEQVVNDMLPSRYGQAIEEQQLKVLGQPTIDITKLDDGELIEFVAEVEVRPEFTLPDFSKISVEVPAARSIEEGLSEELERLQVRFGSLKPVERPAAEGDFVTINLTATVDGEEVEDAATEGLSHEVGTNDLIDGLDEAVRGLSDGESKEFESKLAFGDHAGKPAVVKVTVTAVKERELPELNDEFAELASEFETMDELRDSLRADVEEKLKSEQASKIRDEVLKAALSQTEFPLPEGLVNEQVNAQIQQVLGQIGGDEDLFNTMLQSQGTTREDYDKESRTNIEEAVRTQLFLDVLAEQEKPEVSQEELNDHILFTAQRYGVEPLQFIQQLQQTNQLGNLFADVRRGKALAAAICTVSVQDSDGNEIDPKIYFGEEELDSKESEEASESTTETDS